MKIAELYQVNNIPNSIKTSKDNKGDFNAVLKNALKNNTKYDHIFEAAGKKFGLAPELLKAMAITESNLNPNAVSRSGARGIMQLMPQTARSLGVKDSFDPVQNIFGGAKYLRKMLDTFNQDIRLALAAYNAGPGNVKKYKGIPPFKETQNYVQKVTSLLGQNQIIPPTNEVKKVENKEIAFDLVTYIKLKTLLLNSKISNVALSIGDTEKSLF